MIEMKWLEIARTDLFKMSVETLSLISILFFNEFEHYRTLPQICSGLRLQQYFDFGNSSSRYSETQTTGHFAFLFLPEHSGATEGLVTPYVFHSFMLKLSFKIPFFFLWAIWCPKAFESHLQPLKSSFLFGNRKPLCEQSKHSQTLEEGRGWEDSPSGASAFGGCLHHPCKNSLCGHDG